MNTNNRGEIMDQITIRQMPDIYNGVGALRPFKTSYRVEYPDPPVTTSGIPVYWEGGPRSEARRVAKRHAKRLGLPVVEVAETRLRLSRDD